MPKQRKTPPKMQTPVIRESAATYAAHTEATVSGIENDEDFVAAQKKKNEGAIRLLMAWLEGSERDEQEQRETWEYLGRALDEDRPSYRKLFP